MDPAESVRHSLNISLLEITCKHAVILDEIDSPICPLLHQAVEIGLSAGGARVDGNAEWIPRAGSGSICLSDGLGSSPAAVEHLCVRVPGLGSDPSHDMDPEPQAH